MALFSTLSDNFNVNATNTKLWTSFATGTATIAQTGGVVVATPPSSNATSSYAGYDNVGNYDLTGSAVFIQIAQAVNAAVGAQQYLKLGLDSNNHYDILLENGGLQFNKTVAGSLVTIASVTFDAILHDNWQISESGGTVSFLTSPDQKNWAVRATTATSNFAVTALFVEFAAGTYQSVASPGVGKFDNFNFYLTGGTTTSVSSTSSTSSSTSSTSTSISSISTSSTSISTSSTSTSASTSSTSISTSSTSSSISSTSSSISSTSMSSTSSSISTSSTSSSISSTSMSSTSMSSTSSSTSFSSISTSFSSTSSSMSSTSASTSSTSFSSTSSSSSTSTTAIPTNLIYSYQDSLTLPIGSSSDVDPDTAYNMQNVAADDGDYFIQRGSEYTIQEYKKKWTNNTDIPSFTYKGRTTEDTRISPLLIQIYNQNAATWETLATINTLLADVDLQTTVTQASSVSNYYDSNNTVTFRVYQQVL